MPLKFLKFCVFFFFPILVFSQELGNSLITNYSPEEYNSHAQNWAVIQDNRGIMYFGNTECIVEYDGVSWKKIYSSNNTIIRSLSADKSGIIYVGAVGDFGYLAADSIGNTIFVSIAEKLDSTQKDFNDVWETVSTKDGIYFRSMNRIFRYNPENEEIKSWTPPNEMFFNPSFVFKDYNGDFIFRIGYQYYKMIENEMLPLEKTNLLDNYFIYKLLPFSEKEFICIGYNQIYKFDISKTNQEPASVFSEKLTEEFSEVNLYMGTIINDEKFVVNSRSNGIYILNNKGDILENINENSNLLNNFVWSSFYSKEEILWLGLNSGISKVEINSPFRIWDKKTNFNESVNSVIRHNGILYLATMNGLFYLKENENNYTVNEIIKIDGTQNELWKFISFFDSDLKKQRLLAASTRHLIEIQDYKIITLREVSYLYNLAQSKLDEKKFYLLSTDKFYIVEINNFDVKTVGTISLPGVLKYFAQENDGTIWVGSTNNGIYKIEQDIENKIDTSKYSKSGIFLNTKVTLFDTLPELNSIRNLKPFIVNEELIVATMSGIYKFNDKKNSFEKDISITNYLNYNEKSIDDIKTDKIGNIFILAGLNFYKFNKINDESYSIDSLIFKRIKDFNKTAIYIEDSTIWIAGVSNLISYNKNFQFDTNYTYQTLIRKVTINENSVIFDGNYYSEKLSEGFKIDINQPENLVPTLDYHYNSLYFNYSSPYFIENENIKYSYKLLGYQEEWSSWTNETKKEYTNLYEGEYIFQVKAKNIFEKESEIAEYHFFIKPPWYRTTLAYFLYLILLIFVVWISIKIYSRRLIKEKLKLERIVQERTKEISQKNAELFNQKEEIQAQAEELEKVNIELEKLSIVASETDNAIAIANKNGDFEWINNAFTRLYGYTFDEFIFKNPNLLVASSNKNLKHLLDECLEYKKSVNYESVMITKSGQKIWAQSTITPILDENHNVSKLIIIDSDITQLKKAEQEILQKNEEISAQKEALEQQNEEISAQRDELEEKNLQINVQNEMIKGSIRYAQTIQFGTLPDKNFIDQNFENFILYRPKDIVSGDFYWYNQDINFYHFAVVDCTGHGVPGAFMSMIGSRILNEIVIQNKNISPAEILNELNESIIRALRQDTTESKDGMDVCLVKVENFSENSKKVIFCGAKRDLIFYDSQKNVVEKLKGDRKTIGGFYEKRNNIVFTNTEFVLQRNSVLYLTTDGYIDQNNSLRRRFSTLRLINIIKEICKKSLVEQKKILENNLDNWQQNEKQRDDITVVGIKI